MMSLLFISFILSLLVNQGLSDKCGECVCLTVGHGTVMDCSDLNWHEVPGEQVIMESTVQLILRNNNFSTCQELYPIINTSVIWIDISENPMFPCTCTRLRQRFVLIDSCAAFTTPTTTPKLNTTIKKSSSDHRFNSTTISTTYKFISTRKPLPTSQHNSSYTTKLISWLVGSSVGTLLTILFIVCLYKLTQVSKRRQEAIELERFCLEEESEESEEEIIFSVV